MRWINAKKKDPPKGNLYFVKMKVKDSNEPWFPGVINYYGGWEIHTDFYEVTYWLDEQAPDPKIADLEKRLKELSKTIGEIL